MFLNHPTPAEQRKEARIKTLLKERYSTLKKIEDEVTAMYRKGKASPSEVAEAKRAARNAELDLCETDAERVAVLEKMLAESKDNKKLAEAGFHAAKLLHSAVLKATTDRLEVEIALECAINKSK